MAQRDENESEPEVDPYGVIADRVTRERFGFGVDYISTGGNCMVLCGRLDSGHFIVISEADDFAMDYEARIAAEDQGEAWGWYVGIYEPDPDESGAWAELPVADALDKEAKFADLERVIRTALDNLRNRVPASG